MKRFLSLFLVAAVLISCLTITAFADDGILFTSSFESSFVDLLDTTEWTAYIDGEMHSTRQLPSIYANGVSSVGLRWRCDTTANLIGFNFCMYFDRAPSSLTFNLYDGRSVTPTLVNQVGKFYYYSYTHSTAFDYGFFTVSASWSASYTGAFRIVNCFGYLPDSFSIDSLDFYHDIEYNLPSNGTDYWYVDRVASVTNAAIPYSDTYASRTNYINAYTLNVNLPVSNASSFSFNFTCLGSVLFDSLTVGVYRGATLVYQLPVEVIEGLGINASLVDDQKAILYSYTCNVDLSGVDLSNYILKIKIETDSWENDGLNHSRLNLTKFAYKQESYNYPWYRRFYNWISVKMTAGYQSIVDAINGDGSAVDEAGQAMQGAADDLNSSANAFDQVETPDIDASTITGDFTQFNASGLAVLAVMTGNPYVTSLLVLVFTFALCAYIFFGKRR